ncbi:uroporphyrinogen-III C-methyltransferase [Firmicutes bacterium M10-2]|nr:uroporphyrinogen-III C-methyltransferase [Firmicutes bacterium M10-2]
MNKVFLVGTGCGGKELMTLKAKQCVEQADCILYDHLIDPDALSYAKENCIRIFVGKESGNHAYSQEEIHEMLIEYGKKYPRVVRLKGGDPYVFGRGGEEAQALIDAGLDFEVVPGISSCIAGLSYAGIPITSRSITQGFRVYTAHSKTGKLPEIDFQELARTKDTVVFLMGRKNLEQIVAGYQAENAHDLPIALISKAAYPEQKVCVGTMDTIIGQCTKDSYPAPALIVVGDVVSLSDQLNWFERLPLFGKRIFFLRNSNRDELIEPLKALGALVDAPIGFEKIVYPLSDLDLHDYEWIVFTSKTAIREFMKQIKEKKIDLRLLPKIAVVQDQSAKELEYYGIYPDLIGKKNAQSLIEQLNQIVEPETRILVPHAQANTDEFMNLNACVDVRVLYEMRSCSWQASYDSYDIGVFTSARSAEAATACQGLTIDTAISIGAKTTAALQKGNFKTIIESKDPSYESIIKCLKGYEKNV